MKCLRILILLSGLLTVMPEARARPPAGASIAEVEQGLAQSSADPAPRSVPTPLARKMERALEPLLKKGARVSAEVRSVRSGKVLYSLNPELALTPASAIKIFTAYAALKRLGPAATFRTSVYTQGGDLYLQGGGDPSLVTERLYLLALDVKRHGVERVPGRIRVDESVFEPELRPEVRIDQGSERAFNAPVSGLSLNYNAMAIEVLPGARPGSPARVTLDPEGGYARLVSHVVTSRPGSGTRIAVARHDARIEVSGRIGVDAAEKTQYLSIEDPVSYVGKTFCGMLSTVGVRISCDKPILRATVPPDALLIARQESPPLAEIIRLMDKFSNNFIAESLARSLAPEPSGKKTDDGVRVVRAEMEKLGIRSDSGVRLASASGLTRLNQVSARDFNEALIQISHDFSVFPELVASLPIAREDGTLKRRFAGYPGEGVIRAKSGSLDGVHALVGFAQPPGGDLLVFSVIVNGADSIDDGPLALALLGPSKAIGPIGRDP